VNVSASPTQEGYADNDIDITKEMNLPQQEFSIKCSIKREELSPELNNFQSILLIKPQNAF